MPRHPHLVVIYGPPVVGKLTVAMLVAERLGYRLLHNHVTIDPVLAVLGFDSPSFPGVVERLRRDLLEAAAKEGVDVVYTIVYAPSDEGHIRFAAEAFEAAGGEASFVRLTAPREVVLARVAEADRTRHRKLTDPETLTYLLDRYDLYADVPDRPGLVLDTATTEPGDAAEAIVDLLSSR